MRTYSRTGTRGEAIERIRQFYEAHRQALFAYAVSLTYSREVAEDVIQSVFYRLLRRGRVPHELQPYVYRAIRNAAIDARRRALQAEEKSSILAPLNGTTDPEEIARHDEVEALLQVLNEDERECIVLKVYNGLTYTEIARIRKVSANTAASWYRRGMEKMQRAAKESLP